MPHVIFNLIYNSLRVCVLFEKEALNDNFESRYESGINFCIFQDFLSFFILQCFERYTIKGAFIHKILCYF